MAILYNLEAIFYYNITFLDGSMTKNLILGGELLENTSGTKNLNYYNKDSSQLTDYIFCYMTTGDILSGSIIWEFNKLYTNDGKTLKGIVQGNKRLPGSIYSSNTSNSVTLNFNNTNLDSSYYVSYDFSFEDSSYNFSSGSLWYAN